MKTFIRLGESILPFVIIWTLFTALISTILVPTTSGMFLVKFGLFLITFVATIVVWLFALWGASECVRYELSRAAGIFRFFWSMPDLVHIIAKHAETNVPWRIAIIFLSPLLPAWIGLLGTIVVIDVALTILCAFGCNWTGRFIPIVLGTVLGIVGIPIWGWASLLCCVIAGVLIALIATVIALPIIPLSDYVQRQATRCS